MTKIDNVTDIRKALLAQGYIPLACVDKQCFLNGRQELEVTAELIESKTWSRGRFTGSTAIRLDGLAFLDIDITDPLICEEVIDAYCKRFPERFTYADVPLLERGTTASCKRGFFFRIDGAMAKSAVRTPRYRASGEGESHMVEILSTKKRYAGAIGLHSKEKGSNYVWLADSPLDVPAAKLPIFTAGELHELLDIARGIFEAHGLERVRPAKRIEDADADAEWLFTIEPDAMFVCDDGETRTLDELKAAAVGVAEGIRCAASPWQGDGEGSNTERCCAHNEGGRFFIHDFHTEQNHMEASLAPEFVDLDEYLPALKKLGDAMPPTGGTGSANLKAAWIRERYAYMPTSRTTPIVPINAKFIDDGAMSVTNFRLDQLPWREETVGPRGGIRKINPVDVWLGDAGRKNVAGYVLRPDRASERTVEEDGKTWVNIYQPPVHDAVGGSPDVLIALMNQLAPEDMERKYFLQVLAHKYRHPDVPGPCVIMVAQDKFGTGRGRFSKLLGKLFEGYAATIQFHAFAGSSYQGSNYNGYEANNVVVVIDEAQQMQGHSKRSVSTDNSAILRDRIGPEARLRQIIVQGKPSWITMVYVTYFVMTNSYDIFRMLEQERRCFVLSNGDPREQAFWEAVTASINNPADVAAFAAWLLTIDLSDFNPYAPPPVTDGKRIMADESESDIDAGLRIVLNELKGRSEIFSALHVLNGMKAIEHSEGFEYPEWWDRAVKSELRKNFSRVGVREGQNWKPMFAGKRYPTYAWNKTAARKWTTVDEHFVKIELRKAGTLDLQSGADMLEMLAKRDTRQSEDIERDTP